MIPSNLGHACASLRRQLHNLTLLLDTSPTANPTNLITPDCIMTQFSTEIRTHHQRNTAYASPAECRLVEEVLPGSFLDQLPKRLIGDKNYDSDKLDKTLKEQYDIEMIAQTEATEAERKTDASSAATRSDER